MGAGGGAVVVDVVRPRGMAPGGAAREVEERMGTAETGGERERKVSFVLPLFNERRTKKQTHD